MEFLETKEFNENENPTEYGRWQSNSDDQYWRATDRKHSDRSTRPVGCVGQSEFSF
jgi:hypothetical protein